MSLYLFHTTFLLERSIHSRKSKYNKINTYFQFYPYMGYDNVTLQYSSFHHQFTLKVYGIVHIILKYLYCIPKWKFVAKKYVNNNVVCLNFLTFNEGTHWMYCKKSF